MNISSFTRKAALASLFTISATVLSTSFAHADPHACVTRTYSGTYTGTTWQSQTVCSAGEFALSAGGFCSTAGDRKGASTTTGTTDRLVWLWCNQTGPAIWYAVCCQP